ncbi:unnamed protein product (macronuclear) [Paramecium tetraurelia]|uniref:Uncharacterized protein n=1 Tax=Paramecium tetraurelia TaxID=5888 RepID=A0CZH5_PARTE|nr:uncharacterized protein GSPATT00011765001 [Paramecium tetraurelia]CAK76192.1 unnamed protein product [Paramecium tetraurelia]|eukprot:XP_001443589.1 hypothetical protein (macronuclear) [Paramecium tetraurelia strain d4-2]
MSKVYELYIHLLVKQQHSPMISTISKYEPSGFKDDNNPLCMANKFRVMRYRSEKLLLPDNILQHYINLFRHNRQLFILFLRQLTSPVQEHELSDQQQIENIIQQIELDSILIEQMNLWSNIFQLTQQQLQSFFLCQNMSDYLNFLKEFLSDQLQRFQNIDLSQINLDDDYQKNEQTQIIYVNEMYENHYKPSSKKKLVSFTHKNELSESDQNSIIKIIQKKKLASIRDIYNAIITQFDLQPKIQYTEQNGQWICQIEIKQIQSKQTSQNKSLSLICSQIHVIKQLCPVIFDYILENSNQDIDQIKNNKGNLNLALPTSKNHKLIPQEDYLKQLPYNYELIENYIEHKNSNETCAIRKLQNEVTNYLIQKYNKFSINKQLLSVASTYELTMTFVENGQLKQIQKTFTTKLRFCNARLIGQQYIINVIGNLIFGEERSRQFDNINQFLLQIQ